MIFSWSSPARDNSNALITVMGTTKEWNSPMGPLLADKMTSTLSPRIAYQGVGKHNDRAACFFRVIQYQFQSWILVKKADPKTRSVLSNMSMDSTASRPELFKATISFPKRRRRISIKSTSEIEGPSPEKRKSVYARGSIPQLFSFAFGQPIRALAINNQFHWL